MSRSDGSAPLAAELFTILGARPLSETPLQLHQVWIGELAGRVYGITTSPPGYVSPGLDQEKLQRHAAIAAIQRCFGSDDFVELLASKSADLDLIFSDLAETAMDEALLVVNDRYVPCSTMTYEEVEFASGSDPLRWPFTVARIAWSQEPWPVLAGPTPLDAADSDTRSA